MGRKVFVSVLGMGRGGKYDVCKYGNREDGFECETEFIQEATLRYLTSKGEEWTPDKVVILLTDKAREMTCIVHGLQVFQIGIYGSQAEGLEKRLVACS